MIELDEVGYVLLAEIGTTFVLRVIAERAEGVTLIATTNLPCSEPTQVFPNPRICTALLNRVTDGRRKKLRNGWDWARPCVSMALAAPS